MKTDLVKGFKDFTGKDAEKRNEIKKAIAETFESYGFEPAETPIVEYEEFVRGNNASDEAVRDVFKLKDRGKRSLALRYEFTFQLKRLMKNKKLPYKRYQMGALFRDEPIREGRTRQFIQCDMDTIGSNVKDEAEILAVVKEVFEKLGIKFTIYYNNRKLMNEILEKEGVQKKNREQVIREIDKLDKLSKTEVKKNLKKYKAERLLNIFSKPEKYFQKYNFYKDVIELRDLCKEYGIKFEFRPFLARGLAYYHGSVWEVWAKDLNVSACGGGSYIFDGIQSTGISFGLEPLFLLSKLKIKKDKTLIVSLNQDKKSLVLAKKFRKSGKNVGIFYGKPSKALEYANAYNYTKAIFIGDKEVRSKKYKVKDLKTGKEKREGF